MTSGPLSGWSALKHYPAPLDAPTVKLLLHGPAGRPAASSASAGTPAKPSAPKAAGTPALEVQQAEFAKALVWSVDPATSTNIMLSGDSSMSFKVSKFIDNKLLCQTVAELLGQPYNNYYKKAQAPVDHSEHNFVFHNTFNGGTLIELDGIIDHLMAGKTKLNITYKKGNPLTYDLAFPYSNQQPLDEDWGIVALFWQFNDLVTQQGQWIEPTDEWWLTVHKLASKLQSLRVGVVLGAESTMWDVSPRYNNVVATVRRIFTHAGIPWFDGTAFYEKSEMASDKWHLAHNQCDGTNINVTRFAQWALHIADFLSLLYAHRYVEHTLDPRAFLRYIWTRHEPLDSPFDHIYPCELSVLP